MDTSKQIGPFVYGENLVKRFDYTLGVALAYNAFGLIGPEKNGIFILDQKRMAVVLDEQLRQFGFGGRPFDRALDLDVESVLGGERDPV